MKGNQVPKPPYEFKVLSNIDLPPGATSPVMDSWQMTAQLNAMAEQGWEFVSYGATHWNSGPTQAWWIFRRPKN